MHTVKFQKSNEGDLVMQQVRKSLLCLCSDDCWNRFDITVIKFTGKKEYAAVAFHLCGM